jgi:hypothetical protein
MAHYKVESTGGAPVKRWFAYESAKSSLNSPFAEFSGGRCTDGDSVLTSAAAAKTGESISAGGAVRNRCRRASQEFCRSR